MAFGLETGTSTGASASGVGSTNIGRPLGVRVKCVWTACGARWPRFGSSRRVHGSSQSEGIRGIWTAKGAATHGAAMSDATADQTPINPVLGELAVGFVYWLALVLVLEPGNVLRSDGVLPPGHEIARLIAAASLG